MFPGASNLLGNLSITPVSPSFCISVILALHLVFFHLILPGKSIFFKVIYYFMCMGFGCMHVSVHQFMSGAFREQKRCLVSRHGCWEPNVVLCKNQCSHHRAHSPATEVSILMQDPQNLFSIIIHVITGINFQNCNF